jgi:hypothetical protein
MSRQMHHNMVHTFSSHLEAFLIGLVGTTDSFFGTSLFRPAALLGGFAYLGVPKLLTGAETPLVRFDVKFRKDHDSSSCVRISTKS